MCTVVILRRPGHAWPLLLAGNRDEMMDRPWDAPARHWPDRPDVVAGRDRLAGGTWLGLNDSGVVAILLNRRGTLSARRMTPAAGANCRWRRWIMPPPPMPPTRCVISIHRPIARSIW